jgi:hypothetical protein
MEAFVADIEASGEKLNSQASGDQFFQDVKERMEKFAADSKAKGEKLAADAKAAGEKLVTDINEAAANIAGGKVNNLDNTD